MIEFEMPMPIDAQVARMKLLWPRFATRGLDRLRQSVRWVGDVAPQFGQYTLDVSYRVGNSPQVRVVSPALIRLPGNAEGELPHVYPPTDDPTLCLFDPDASQWNWTMPIADTTIYWACDWLACYELWLMTGLWRGGGRHAGDPINPREDTL